MTAPLAVRVTAALSANGYLSTAGLARHFGVGRDRIAAALDEIEAAGIRLHRTHGLDGGAEIDEAAQAPRADVAALLAEPWPANPVVTRAATAIAGMAAQAVPGQPALLAKRMRRRMNADEASLAKVAARLAELGVFSGFETERAS